MRGGLGESPVIFGSAGLERTVSSNLRTSWEQTPLAFLLTVLVCTQGACLLEVQGSHHLANARAMLQSYSASQVEMRELRCAAFLTTEDILPQLIKEKYVCFLNIINIFW